MKANRISISLFASVLFAQSAQLTVTPPAGLVASPGDTVESAVTVKIGKGLHANSNAPNDPFLIPMRLTWNSGALESTNVAFPKPQIRYLGFSKKPVSVFTDEITILTNFKVTPGTTPGNSSLTGKLHYQACDDKSCFPPATVEVTLPVEITPGKVR